ncbi:MAG: ferrous iron transport protein B, partial [Clostridia bacterium]
LAVNMMDEVERNENFVNIQALSQALKIPAVGLSASKNKGLDELIKKMIDVAKNKEIFFAKKDSSSDSICRCLDKISCHIKNQAKTAKIPIRFAAVKIIENDKSIMEKLNLKKNELAAIENLVLNLETECGLDRNTAIADMRYSFIERICKKSVVKKSSETKERRRSEKIDKILTNKYAAIPLFFLILFLTFFVTFEVIGEFFQSNLNAGIEFVTDVTKIFFAAHKINPIIQSLVIGGVFNGIGTVLSFLPTIITLFFFLSLLEDTGYMARAAFIMDALLRKIGLSGKSIVPLLIGFGCSVPAVIATRTLCEHDRKLTVLLVPFMSCSAKIPIYAVFASAFFPNNKALVILGLYMLGIFIAIVAASLLKNTAFVKEAPPFFMELPNYRLPSLKSTSQIMLAKGKDFLEKAFTVIFIASLLIRFLQNFDFDFNVVTDAEKSILAELGKAVSPIFFPLGFKDWKISASLLSGFSAKEAVISTMSVLLKSNANTLPFALKNIFTTASSLSFLTFCLLYTPCIAAIAAIKREYCSIVKTIGVMLFQFCVAWSVSWLVYQAAQFLL